MDFDWRIWGYTFLTKDVPAAFSGGPSHKAGEPIFYASLTRNADGGLIGFTQPRPAAMAIDIAINTALRANALKQKLELMPTITPHGKGLQVNNSSHLFDYFECCMVSVTFCVQSLDTFCNEIVEAYVKGTIPIRVDKKMKNLNKIQLQENFSLKMKIGTILPKIFSINSPENLADPTIWKKYIELERVRNTTVHLKTSDENSGVNIDRDSLFSEFFKTNTKDYPSSSLDIMEYFKPNINNNEWITKAREKISSDQ